MEDLRGYVQRIVFQNEDNGFTVAKLKIDGAKDLVCVVGSLLSVRPGESIRCQGFWKQDPKFGLQFVVKKYVVDRPSTCVGIQKYLSSNLVKGIGPVFAARIVEKFKEHTLTIIDETPDRLQEVEGIGASLIAKVKACWQSQKHIRDIILFLQSHHVSPSYAQKIYKCYRNNSLRVIQENPYRLAKDIWGIGFKRADAMAKHMGIASDAKSRIDAGIDYVLSELATEGHTCYPVTLFLQRASELLNGTEALIRQRLYAEDNQSQIIIKSLFNDRLEEDYVWLKSLYDCEEGIADEIKRLKQGDRRFRAFDYKKALVWAQKELDIVLDSYQEKAVLNSLSKKFHIITGGPGTGKSTITKVILHIYSQLSSSIKCVAPTGRASKRLSEVTGKAASTIHSLLEVDFMTKGFKKNKENPLTCDVLIVDEASMIDTILMYSLLKALPDYTCCIFIGDSYQLPSVGPGNVLKEFSSPALSTPLLQAESAISGGTQGLGLPQPPFGFSSSSMCL